MRTARIRTHQPDTTNWQAHAACTGEDPNLFHPDSYTSPSGEYAVALAKTICAACPARAFCLYDALDREGQAKAESRNGIWGGLTPDERANLAGAGRARRSYRRAA